MLGPLPEDQKYRMRSNELYSTFWNSRYTDPWQMFWNEHYIKYVISVCTQILVVNYTYIYSVKIGTKNCFKNYFKRMNVEGDKR